MQSNQINKLTIEIEHSTRSQIIKGINDYKQLLSEKYLIGNGHIDGHRYEHGYNHRHNYNYQCEMSPTESSRILKKKVIEVDHILDKLCLHEWYDDHIETEINNMRPITYCLLCERTLNYS